MKLLKFTDPELTEEIKVGKVGILPTDTIYGIHASALNPHSIERMYQIRLRDTNKPFIVLINNLTDLHLFGIELTAEQNPLVETVTKESVSIVLPINNQKFNYLTRDTHSIAFRIPKHHELKSLLTKTGPLVSTSVNKQGEQPCETIAEAQVVFGDSVDFAVDEGRKLGMASTVVELVGTKVRILRQGAAIIPAEFLVE